MPGAGFSKLDRIDKYLEDAEADVTLRTEKNEQIAEICVSANGILSRQNPILFQPRNEYNFEQNFEFLKAVNFAEIENVSDQIVCSIKEFKQAKEDKIR